jgi:5-hydroxyisourate hydrolase
MAGKLSTHILDTYHGAPAGGVHWTLDFYDESGAWTRLSAGLTNSDGRTDTPLLVDAALKTGKYRITFAVGAYFEARGLSLPKPAFLDEVVLQVSLQAGESYHVPLLTSPWSYSTYRGS